MTRHTCDSHERDHGRCECTGRPDGNRSVDDVPSVREPLLGRRSVLVGGAAAVVGLAGCSALDSGSAPAPVALTDDDQCDGCGMVIPNHPGPVAEIFYADERPSDHDNPAHFCSTWEAFQYNFERQDRGWTVEGFYVTDYSTVDYEVRQSGGDTVISSHPEADAFVDAETVTFVVGSEVKGAMGRDLVGFTDSDDAESFREEYGGRLAAFDEVTRETVDQLGMA